MRVTLIDKGLLVFCRISALGLYSGHLLLCSWHIVQSSHAHRCRSRTAGKLIFISASFVHDHTSVAVHGLGKAM